MLRHQPRMGLATAAQRGARLAAEKRSLASIVRDQGALPIADAVDIALDLCDELAPVHANGVVHGDLGLHRIRLVWPWRVSSRIEIFSRSDDSHGFGPRGDAPLVAPEQREGRLVDRRADVWAVGALLHWMLAGAPPGRGALQAPGTIKQIIARCLAESPDDRPESVDEISEVLGSFASSPADRFEQLARRRSMQENAERVRRDLGDVDGVLGRLDEAALAREMTPAAMPGSAVFEKAERYDPVDEPLFGETVAAVTAPMPMAVSTPLPQGMAVATPLPQGMAVATPLPHAMVAMHPPVSLAPVAMAVPQPRLLPSSMAPRRDSSTAKTATFFAVLGIIALGVAIGAKSVDRVMADAPSPPARAVAAPPPPADPPPPVASAPPVSAVPVIQPAALPDAPAVRETRGTASPPRPKPAVSTAPPAASSGQFELSPASLSDALR